ncbi:MAG: hypothetical protein ACYDH6_08440 [Acidimicrobiales bacterium]
MQRAALDHRDPSVRRASLGFLDHYAADESGAVFAAALNDPVAAVRDAALHGLACEQCRTAELCIADVTPKVAGVLAADRNPEVRYKTLPVLLRLAARDPAAAAAIVTASRADPDERVRHAAESILAGERPRGWNEFRRTFRSRQAKASRRSA